MQRRRRKNIIIVIILVICILVVSSVVIWAPFKSKLELVEIVIKDTNHNFFFEEGEKLTFEINDTSFIENRKIDWYFGNGDELNNIKNAEYTYSKSGKYLVSLKIDDQFEVSKYVEVITKYKETAIDSILKVYGVTTGYVGEVLVFSAHGNGVKSWLWEFGETGTVDAYEKQVVYKYSTPGTYTVKINTNISKYPYYHQITILPLFEALIEEAPTDSIEIAQEDIKKRLQKIANTSIFDVNIYYANLNYIKKQYTCSKAEDVVVITNGEKYNDLYSYCQGLHILEGKGAHTVKIDDVKIDTFNCLKRIEVTQSLIKD